MSKQGLSARLYAPNQTLIMVNGRLPQGILSRGAVRPRFARSFVPRKQRAQGKPGARSTRSPCALVVSTRWSPRVRRKSPGFPRAMVLTVSFALSSATNSFLSPSPRGLRFVQARLGRRISTRLDISNGCQDHTTSPYAATSPNASTGHVPPADVLAKALKRRSSARWLFAHRS
jgi:hypothetical protein